MGMRAVVVLFAVSLLGLLRAQERSGDAPLLAVQRMALATAPAAGIAVEVRSERGKPVAGALVAVLPTQWTAEQGKQVEGLHGTHAGAPNQALAATVQAFGTCYRCDDAGRVLVPTEARRIAAFDGNYAGEVRLNEAPTKPVDLRLLGPRALLVRVLNVDGKPTSGVKVQLGAGQFFGYHGDAVSDARGDSLVRMRMGVRQEQGMWVEAQLAGAPVRVDVPEPWPRAPIELRVPASGMLRVIAYDGKEQPRTDVQRVHLVWAGHMRGIDGDAESSGATFRVALGRRFDVEVELKGTAGRMQTSVVGPVRAGELVVCEVRATKGPPTALLRVRGLDGKPLAGTVVGVVFVGDKFARGEDVTTDGEGWLRMLLDNDKEGATELILLRRETDRRRRTQSSLGAVRIALPAEWKAGENTLAEATLQEEPVVAAGVVTDDTGKPMANVAVSTPASWNRQSTSFSGSMFASEVHTDAEGRFALRALDADDEVKLTVRAPAAHEVPDATVAKGVADVRIVLHRQGRARLTLRDVPKANHRLFTGFLVAPGEKPNGNGREVKADTLLTTRAGTYDLVLRLTDDGPDLVRIPNLVFEAGKDTVDPRLEKMDCSAFAKGITITVVQPDGKPAKDQQVMCMVTVGKRKTGRGGRTDSDGNYFTFVPPEDGVQVTVGGAQMRGFGPPQKYRRVVLTNVTADQRIELKPTLQVRLKPAGDVMLPAGVPVLWNTGGKGVEAMLLGLLQGGGTLQADGTITFVLDEPGQFDVTMTATETVDGRPVQHRFAWGKIDVKDVVEEQAFAVALEAEDVQRLAELRERNQPK